MGICIEGYALPDIISFALVLSFTVYLYRRVILISKKEIMSQLLYPEYRSWDYIAEYFLRIKLGRAENIVKQLESQMASLIKKDRIESTTERGRVGVQSGEDITYYRKKLEGHGSGVASN